MDRGRDGPNLKDYGQVLLADAYAGYKCCGRQRDHARRMLGAHERKIIDAEKSAPEIAREAVERGMLEIESEWTAMRRAGREPKADEARDSVSTHICQEQADMGHPQLGDFRCGPPALCYLIATAFGGDAMPPRR